MIQHYAERTDQKLRQHIRYLISSPKTEQSYLHEKQLEATSDFNRCMEDLSRKIHLFSKHDPNLNGFLNTMDRYMKMIDLNHPRPHLEQVHGFPLNDNDSSRISIKQTLEEFHLLLQPSDTIPSATKKHMQTELKLVAKVPEVNSPQATLDIEF